MASEPKEYPLAAQIAAVRAMLAEDPKLTLEGIETAHPEFKKGVEAILAESKKPTEAKSGAAPVEPMSFTDIL